jgi:catechol 2,3-dioxygenase-like lactoylglutathione lyase family enzyme
VIVGLDHVSIAVADVDEAARAYQAFLGLTAERPEGRAWLQLGNVALDLHQGGAEGLGALAFAVNDLEAARRRLERRGAASAAAEPLDGRAMSLVDAGATHGVAIAVIEAAAGRPRTGGDIEGLDHVVIMTQNSERAVALYGARLGLDLRLDRSNPAWGARQLFFRCGDMVVEAAARLDAPVSDTPDRLSGLAWRARDPVAARERLAAAGFDVSEVRKGRKPGTAVFTLRAGVPGAPALVIGAGG